MNFLIIRNILIIYLLIIFTTISSAIVTAQNRTIVLPYEMIAGKMVVKMEINGKEERLFFDTGAGNSAFSWEYIQINGLNIVDSISVTDVSSRTMVYMQVKIDSITTSDRSLLFQNFKALVIPESSPLKCYNVIGIIGSDLLEQTLCTINPQEKSITISLLDKPLNEYARYSHNFSVNGNLPIFQIQINGEFINVLFDTGSSSFINLKRSDYESLKEQNLVTIIKKGFGSHSIGLSGKEAVDSSYRIFIPNLKIGPVKVSAAISEIENVPVTLLGARILQYAKVIINYPRKRLYIIPFSNDIIRLEYKFPNFGITVKEGQLVIADIWDRLLNKFSVGDVITHVNGKPSGRYDFCDIIKGVDILKGDEAKMVTIRTKEGKIIEEIYQYEFLNL